MFASLQKTARAGAMVRHVSQVRGMSSPASKSAYGPVCPKVRELQDFYTNPANSAPIYIKRGTPDKVLYYITIFMTAVGFANVIKRSYERGLC